MLAAAVMPMTTTAYRAVAAATAAMGTLAGGLAALAFRRLRVLCFSAHLPAHLAKPQPSSPPLTEASLVMGLLLCHSRSYSCCLVCLPLPAHPSVRTQVACPFSAGQDPMQGSRVRLSHPGAQRSHPQSVLRFLIIPEVLNIISTNLGRIRVGALMTSMGSLNPNIGSQERGVD